MSRDMTAAGDDLWVAVSLEPSAGGAVARVYLCSNCCGQLLLESVSGGPYAFGAAALWRSLPPSLPLHIAADYGGSVVGRSLLVAVGRQLLGLVHWRRARYQPGEADAGLVRDGDDGAQRKTSSGTRPALDVTEVALGLLDKAT